MQDRTDVELADFFVIETLFHFCLLLFFYNQISAAA